METDEHTIDIHFKQIFASTLVAFLPKEQPKEDRAKVYKTLPALRFLILWNTNLRFDFLGAFAISVLKMFLNRTKVDQVFALTSVLEGNFLKKAY